MDKPRPPPDGGVRQNPGKSLSLKMTETRYSGVIVFFLFSRKEDPNKAAL